MSCKRKRVEDIVADCRSKLLEMTKALDNIYSGLPEWDVDGECFVDIEDAFGGGLCELNSTQYELQDLTIELEEALRNVAIDEAEQSAA